MRPRAARPRPLPPRLTPDEAQAHAQFVAKLGEDSVWARFATT
jgi:DNA polymerase-3 subunit epsilon